jgi:hypothetical protein
MSVDTYCRSVVVDRYLAGVLDLAMLSLAVLAIALVMLTVKQYARSLLRTELTLRTVDLRGDTFVQS